MNQQAAKTVLLEKQSELSKRIAAIKNDFQQGRSKDFSEQTTENENNEVLVNILSEAEKELNQVNVALDKMQQGDYGVCAQCGESIAVNRLEALPFVTECINCASEHERSA